MERKAIDMFCFALVLVRLGRRFLLVHERKHGQRWYVPAGRLEPGESWVDAARRETMEEAGIAINLEGILRIEHQAHKAASRMRIIFIASPIDDTLPRRTPNEHTLSAGWFSLQEMTSLPLRSEEVLEVAAYVLGGGTIYPLHILRQEGSSWTL
jgi:8-oxo-dGTP pyrophosphatase MutT (NUDIX family)